MSFGTGTHFCGRAKSHEGAARAAVEKIDDTLRAIVKGASSLGALRAAAMRLDARDALVTTGDVEPEARS